MLNRSLKFAVAFVVFCISALSYSEEVEDINPGGPRMEFGVGLVTQFIADYRGSTYYSFEALPLPYFLYTGKIIKVDRQGIRGEFVTSPRFEFNVSVDGSLNGNSDGNVLREGMPELDSTFEFGPSFNINLTGQDFRQGWSLRMPLRAVFSFDSKGVDYVGYLFNPRLTWRAPSLAEVWRFSFNAGLLWADENYHAYYYDVAPEYALPWRPEYQASSGYSGTFMRWGLYRQLDEWRVGFSLRYDYLGGTSFEKSPLVETEHFASVSFGLARELWLSQR